MKNFRKNSNNIKHGRRNAQMLDLSNNNSPVNNSLEWQSATFEAKSPTQIYKHASKLSILNKANNMNN